MEALKVALTIYGLGFIVTFLLAVMIKLMMTTIKYFNRDTTKRTESVLEKEGMA